jgi:hypothetical protein
MQKKKIFLISPREPCGASWLINCLLVLGIKTYRSTVEGEMWIKDGGRFFLNPHEMALKKWLPVLSEVETFRFREGVEVEWAHIWPTRFTAGAKVVYFIRDPRDALFSRYRRESPDVTFREFLDFPDSQTLLDKVDTWCLFNEAWLQQQDLLICRFEDYRLDARATLQAVLDGIGVVADPAAIDEAVLRSGYERAAAAEKRYRAANPWDTQIINRASQVGSWKDPSLRSEMADITERCRYLLTRFGYAAGGVTISFPSYRPNSNLLGFYRNLSVPSSFWDRPADGREKHRVLTVFDLSIDVSVETFDKYRLETYERWQLLNALEEFISATSSLQYKRIGRIKVQSGALPRSLWNLAQYLSNRRIRIPRRLKDAVINAVKATRAVKSAVKTRRR